MSFLSAEGVSHGYSSRRSLLRRRPAQPVLSEVSLEIAPGETLGLLGRSGCGKSTLARLLTGLETPSLGTVRFQGNALSNLDKPGWQAFRRQVQMVFQDPQNAVNPRLTVSDIISEPLIHLTDLDRAQHPARVAELLDAVGLARRLAHRYPFELSGGQLQRVCIARALAPRPSLIVLDEAVSNLDLHLQLQMLELFTALQRDVGVAFLFVTHDLRLVERFCSRVLVMGAGRLVEDRPVTSPLTLTSPEGQALFQAVLPAFPVQMTSLRERLPLESVS
ncbi:nickel import ATP-binding protein NikE [Halomonas sp. GD1P12]|uniref:nickel import ATP-binding protein NikE n=1 Tax=Halomonas sp. GD1P12 TaxID=2982691 RepID=UPI0021E46C3D|nr:nickel import ATP-binding protein NikE [Halomonas sp. GD1P12]UYF99528.1 nickel import ATP-binding protein NikE [Halomonas sp. GD1P12]